MKPMKHVILLVTQICMSLLKTFLYFLLFHNKQLKKRLMLLFKPRLQSSTPRYDETVGKHCIRNRGHHRVHRGMMKPLVTTV